MSNTTLPFVPMRPDNISWETSMGRVVVTARIENNGDLWDLSKERIDESEVRGIEVENALVDTGCSTIGLPTHLIQELGLEPLYTRPVRRATGLGETTVYDSVRLTIQDRICVSHVFEVPDSIPVLIGQIPLEQLDFVIDMKNQRLIGNPDHGGEHILEAY